MKKIKISKPSLKKIGITDIQRDAVDSHMANATIAVGLNLMSVVVLQAFKAVSKAKS